MDFDRSRLREGCSESWIKPIQTGLRVDGMIEKQDGRQEEMGIDENDGWIGALSRALLS